jgi:DNA-binding transcriptional ArsR family regulator
MARSFRKDCEGIDELSAARKSPADSENVNAETVDIDGLFHALGDPTRRRILDRLVDRPLSGSHLAEAFGITLTAVMQHLKILENARLVHTEKVGRVRSCRLELAGFRALEQWSSSHRTVWEKRLDQLGRMLEDEG